MEIGPPQVEALGADECRRLLATVTVGRVGICVGALPAIRTVRFRVASGHVVFRARHGSRLYGGSAGNIVAFHADRYDDLTRRGWAVQALGRCVELTPGPWADEVARSLAPLWPDTGPDDPLLALRLDQLSGEQVRWPGSGAGNDRVAGRDPPPGRPL